MERKKIALITGATSGMGRQFVLQIQEVYPWLDEIWVIARNRERLAVLQEEVHSIRSFPMDITSQAELRILQQVLEEEKPKLQFLVNSAGAGIQKEVEDTEVANLWNMTQLNVSALTAVTGICLPYCAKDCQVICLASGAAFVPQPGFAVYAATKAYVLSFSRALRREWKGRLTVTAVCPGPVDTPFLDKMGGKEHMPAYKKWFLAKPEAVVKKALKDSARGKELSIYGISVKALHILCKILPHRLILRFL